MNAAMKEFAHNGFKNASTDEIVKDAGISKGALFHYFNSKKDLFLFLYDYAIETFRNDILSKFNSFETDIFVRLREGSLLKFEIFKKHPEMNNFALAAYIEVSNEVKHDVELRNTELIKSSEGKLLEGVDFSKFKEGIDTNKAINIIIWTIEGFANTIREKARLHSSFEIINEEVIVEMDVYFDLLKAAFYK